VASSADCCAFGTEAWVNALPAAAALDRGELAIVARAHHLGAGHLRLAQQFARDLGVEHRHLVDHDQRAQAACGMAVLQPEQLGMNRRGPLEPVMAEILSHGVRRRQADHLIASRIMRLPDRAARETLAGPGAALDDLQPARSRGVLERRALVRTKRRARRVADIPMRARRDSRVVSLPYPREFGSLPLGRLSRASSFSSAPIACSIVNPEGHSYASEIATNRRTVSALALMLS
jgi:hypothetical protein